MKPRFATLVVLLTLPAAAEEARKPEAPLLASPADLKWTALPERPGMQFAVDFKPAAKAP